MMVLDSVGESIHAEVLGEIERQVGAAIIAQRLPIRGAEVEFLRKALGCGSPCPPL